MANSGDPRVAAKEGVKYSQIEYVTMHIGYSKTAFVLPRSLVLSSSLKLKHVFEDEEATLTYWMPREPVTFFNLHVNWLHSGYLPTKDMENMTHSGICDLEYNVLTELYLLGRRLEDDSFADTVASGFLAKVREHAVLPESDGLLNLPGSSCINMIYRKEQTQKLKALLIKAYTCEGSKRNVERVSRDVTGEFLKDLRSYSLDTVSDCMFHLHAEGEECSIAKGSLKRKRSD